MKRTKYILKSVFLYKVVQRLFVPLFFAALLFFFCFRYMYHLLFAEQLQIFQFTSLYWEKYLSVPGGVAAYAGEFFTQFYYLGRIGGVILCLCLFIIYLMLRYILHLWRFDKAFAPLLLLPCAALAISYTDTNACLGGAVSVLLALLVSAGCIAIQNRIVRWCVAPVAFVLLYWVSGGGLFIFAGLMCLNEFKKETDGTAFLITLKYALFTVIIPLYFRQYVQTLSWYSAWIGPAFYNAQLMQDIIYCIILLPVAVFVVITVTSCYLNTEKQRITIFFISLLFPVLFLGAGYHTEVKQNEEDLFQLDYYAKQEKWDEIITLAKKEKQTNALFITYTNLALAKKGNLSASMFSFMQRPDATAFWTPGFYPTSITAEIYYHLDMAQTARAFFFMANTQSPKSQSAWMYKRLAEIEILTGNFDLALKYIHTLKQTLFYKTWASKMEQISITRQLTPELKRKQSNQPRNEGFFAMEFKYNLLVQYSENKKNFFVFDYLMMELMLENDFQTFMQCVDDVYPSVYKVLPVSYQQFILMYAYMQNNNSLVTRYAVSQPVIQAFYDYMQQNQQSLSPGQMQQKLNELYGDTYWYYAQYINKIKK